MASEQPSKEDIAQFIAAWRSLNIHESMGKKRMRSPEADEHAAVRRVAVWLEDLAA